VCVKYTIPSADIRAESALDDARERSLHMAQFQRRLGRQNPLDRTQEVAGSSPASSISTPLGQGRDSRSGSRS
jgi:hypothetical protein